MSDERKERKSAFSYEISEPAKHYMRHRGVVVVKDLKELEKYLQKKCPNYVLNEIYCHGVVDEV